ncbi:MAG: c-type cytochrome biogenesis protein CcmI [Alphaproteobacteria bacterium PA2]|nr:MAG: c-type cytochrome biogenesis protein CcmI [Alphaproteobacteria bacterium PA2]
MITLWVAAGALSAAAAIVILLRAAGAASNGGSGDPTLDVYRRQLGELDALADNGLLDPDEHATAKAEAGRRLLGAADHQAAVWSSATTERPWVAGVVAVVGASALALYLLVGSSSLQDQPMFARIAKWRATDPGQLTAPEMVVILRQVTAQRPDPEGLRYLALAETQSQNPSGAARALRKAITLAPQRADLWEMLGEVLVIQADGQESEAAQNAFQEAIKRDPKAMVARFHLARARDQAGDRDGAVAALRAIEADLPSGDPRRQDVQQAIREALAPRPAPSPEAPAVGGDQMGMIRSMVASLADKLKANPDDPDGWVRLVRSYSVLGDVKARDAALAQAQARYRGRADIMSQLDAASKTEAMK